MVELLRTEILKAAAAALALCACNLNPANELFKETSFLIATIGVEAVVGEYWVLILFFTFTLPLNVEIPETSKLPSENTSPVNEVTPTTSNVVDGIALPIPTLPP